MYVPQLLALLLAGATVPAPAAAAPVAPLALPTLAVGATTSVNDTVGSGNTCAGFLDERAKLGTKLSVRRVFSSTGALPPADAVTCQTQQGATLWYSFKTSCTPVNVYYGYCDAEIMNIANAMPQNSYLTYYHEPENDMTGVQFVNAFMRVYWIAKYYNPSLNIIPVYMGYQWRPGSTRVTNNGTGGDYEMQDWAVPIQYADGYGIDLYWQASTRGSEPDDPVSVGSDPRMLRWYNWFTQSGKPLTLTEWGIDDDVAPRVSRGPAIRASRTWLTARNFRVISYWQHDNWYLGTTTVPAGGYADPDGVAAYQELVASATP